MASLSGSVLQHLAWVVPSCPTICVTARGQVSLGVIRIDRAVDRPTLFCCLLI